jgi:hypothetical protein
MQTKEIRLKSVFDRSSSEDSPTTLSRPTLEDRNSAMINLLRFSTTISLFFSPLNAHHGLHHHPVAIRWVDCSNQIPDVPGALDLTDVDLRKLPPTLHCGRLEVPMDYDRPLQAGNMIEIGIAMHRPSEPKGVIFYNPGGTDAGIVLAWQIALDQTKIFEGLLDHDLLCKIRGKSTLEMTAYSHRSHGCTWDV